MGCITSSFIIKDTLSVDIGCKTGIDTTVDAMSPSAVTINVIHPLITRLRIISPVAVDMVCTPIDAEPEKRKPLTASIVTKPPLRASFSIRSLKVKWREKPATNVTMTDHTRVTTSFRSKDGAGVVFCDKSCVDVAFNDNGLISVDFVEVCPIDVKLPCFTTKGWDNELPWMNDKGWNN